MYYGSVHEQAPLASRGPVTECGRPSSQNSKDWGESRLETCIGLIAPVESGEDCGRASLARHRALRAAELLPQRQRFSIQGDLRMHRAMFVPALSLAMFATSAATQPAITRPDGRKLTPAQIDSTVNRLIQAAHVTPPSRARTAKRAKLV